MEVIPLKRNLYDRAKALGLTEITFNFMGGSDEGYLDVQLDYDSNHAALELFAELLRADWTALREAEENNSKKSTFIYPW